MPAGQDKVQLTLTLPLTSAPEAVSLSLEGRAIIQGKEIVRRAVPADNTMQAFAYWHLVPAQELRVSATGRGPAQGAVRILADRPLKIPAGGTAPVQIAFPALGTFDKVQLQLNDPPEGITVREVTLGQQGGANVVLQCDAAKAKPKK